jgi:hypothetical protein
MQSTKTAGKKHIWNSAYIYVYLWLIISTANSIQRRLVGWLMKKSRNVMEASDRGLCQGTARAGPLSTFGTSEKVRSIISWSNLFVLLSISGNYLCSQLCLQSALFLHYVVCVRLRLTNDIRNNMFTVSVPLSSSNVSLITQTLFEHSTVPTKHTNKLT